MRRRYQVADTRNYVATQLIVDFAAEQRIPATYPWRESVAAGGLMSYGPDDADLFRRAAGVVHRILKGAKPADIPIEQPTKLELLRRVGRWSCTTSLSQN